ncbi:MAG: sodium:calcium antiporter [Gammaproteobacteria bacterium]|nr:sodium:calcium antiporter [Gammaproteobacteria bacterium]|tara:strand:+ start:18527 stop:19453 length:927 start_codon:yes stop_codon:yes gene_type:complete
MLDYVLFASGLIVLVIGGDKLVASATRVARRFGMSKLATGVVIVGLGTSLPELLTSVDANLQGYPGAALGNVVGSNIANLLLVLGVGALWLPVAFHPRQGRRDIAWMLTTGALAVGIAHLAVIERWTGVLLLAALGAYLYSVLREPQAGETVDVSADETADNALPVDLALVAVGIAALSGGAHVLVSGAMGIAAQLGISETTTGIVLLALGTSLPELTVTVVSLMRGNAELAAGNVLGSTLFNILGVLGVTALVAPIPVPAEVADTHIWVMAGAMVAFAVVARSSWRITRLEGALLTASYPVYLAFGL